MHVMKKLFIVLIVSLLLATNVSAAPIHRVVKNGDIEKAKQILDKNPEVVNLEDMLGATPLYWAVYKKNAEMVKLVLSYNPDVDRLYYEDKAVIHMATSYNNIDILKLLIDKGADVNVKAGTSGFGATPLHGAVATGNLEGAELLIRSGADVNAVTKDEMKFTPLHFAVMQDNLKMAELLIKNGANMNMLGNGLTPLIMANEKDTKDMFVLLVKNGADINMKSETGCVVLHFAAADGKTEFVRILIDAGAEVNPRCGNNNTPLSVAILRKHEDTAELLRKYGAVE